MLFIIVYSITTVRYNFNRNYIIVDMSVVTRIQYDGNLKTMQRRYQLLF